MGSLGTGAGAAGAVVSGLHAVLSGGGGGGGGGGAIVTMTYCGGVCSGPGGRE